MKYETKKNIKRYSHPHFLVGILVVFWHFFLIFFSIYLYNEIFIQWSFFVLLTVTIIFFIGTRMRALGNIIHECSHGTFVPSRKANIMIGQFLCLLEFNHFESYRKDHFSHHRYLGDSEKDEDFKARLKIGVFVESNLKFSNIFFVILSPKSWFSLLKSNIQLNHLNFAEKVSRVLYILLILFLGFTIGYMNLILFVMIPFFTSYQMMKILSDLLDHGAIYSQDKREHKTRNHYFSLPFLNWLIFPRADCYHLVHHLYPTVPTNQLASKHKEIMSQNVEYSARRHLIF